MMPFAYPYNDVCYIWDNLNGGTRFSGVIIGPHTVLTCSHGLWNSATGQSASTIDVFPGYSGTTDPLISATPVPGAWTDHFFQINDNDGGSDLQTRADSVHDYAVIDLKNYTFSSWFGLATDFGGGTIALTGYPALAGFQQTNDVGTVTANGSYAVLDYGTVVSSGGNSGGPIWVNQGTSANPQPYVVGIVSTGGWGVQLTDADYQTILGWEQQDGVSTSAPELSVVTASGQPVSATPQPYTGPVAGIEHQYIYPGIDNVNISVSDDNWFVHGGSGNDAIAVHGGTNVLDGGTGSNFLVGGTGTDTFFVDDRSPSADIWSTMTNFHFGDAATVFGLAPAANNSNVSWVDGQGAPGFTGLSLHVPEPNQANHFASLTLPGYSTQDLANGRLSVSFGHESDGTPYMYVLATR